MWNTCAQFSFIDHYNFLLKQLITVSQYASSAIKVLRAILNIHKWISLLICVKIHLSIDYSAHDHTGRLNQFKVHIVPIADEINYLKPWIIHKKGTLVSFTGTSRKLIVIFVTANATVALISSRQFALVISCVRRILVGGGWNTSTFDPSRCIIRG